MQEEKKAFVPKLRFDEQELNLIKKTFADNEVLIKIIRKSFLQMDISEFEEEILKKALSVEVLKVVRKLVVPYLDGNAPISQITDHWMWFRLDNEKIAHAEKYIEARIIMIDYLEQRMDELEGNVQSDNLKFDDLLVKPITFQKLYARQLIVDNIEQGLCMQLLLMAGFKSETSEETMERLKRDSNK